MPVAADPTAGDLALPAAVEIVSGRSGVCFGRNEAQARRLRICLLCLSAIKDDPRVRKQGNLLHRAGHHVVAVGLLGGTAPDPDWPIRGVSAVSGAAGGRLRKLAAQPRRYARHFAAKGLQPLAPWSATIAGRAYWGQEIYRRLFEAARAVRADLYVANDWNMLPIADRLARMHGGRFVYDSHEYAAEELPESLIWRVFRKPLATMIERQHIREAGLVSTVSSGIAVRLHRDHRLREAPLVVRNVPEAASGQHAVSPLGRGPQMTLLFHGAITEHRGLHVLVASARHWRPGRRLILRGPIAAAYRRRLEQIVAADGVEERVAIVPPVPADRLIEAAAEADVGIVCLPDTSLENRFALPNKVFEYIAAGLALIVPPLDELRAIVGRYGNGIVFARLAPEAVAAAINELEPAAVDRFKANSRRAATELVWEREAADWLSRLSQVAVA